MAIQLWSTLFTGQTSATIASTDEVLLDTQPGTVTSLQLDGILRVRDGFTLQGIQISGDGVLRPEIITPPAPAVVGAPAWQFRKALNQLGLRDTVEAAVASSASQDLKDGWQFAPIFERNNPLIIAMAAGIGVTDVQLDGLFALAMTL